MAKVLKILGIIVLVMLGLSVITGAAVYTRAKSDLLFGGVQKDPGLFAAVKIVEQHQNQVRAAQALGDQAPSVTSRVLGSSSASAASSASSTSSTVTVASPQKGKEFKDVVKKMGGGRDRKPEQPELPVDPFKAFEGCDVYSLDKSDDIVAVPVVHGSIVSIAESGEVKLSEVPQGKCQVTLDLDVLLKTDPLTVDAVCKNVASDVPSFNIACASVAGSVVGWIQSIIKGGEGTTKADSNDAVALEKELKEELVQALAGKQYSSSLLSYLAASWSFGPSPLTGDTFANPGALVPFLSEEIENAPFVAVQVLNTKITPGNIPKGELVVRVSWVREPNTQGSFFHRDFYLTVFVERRDGDWGITKNEILLGISGNYLKSDDVVTFYVYDYPTQKNVQLELRDERDVLVPGLGESQGGYTVPRANLASVGTLKLVLDPSGRKKMIEFPTTILKMLKEGSAGSPVVASSEYDSFCASLSACEEDSVELSVGSPQDRYELSIGGLDGEKCLLSLSVKDAGNKELKKFESLDSTCRYDWNADEQKSIADLTGESCEGYVRTLAVDLMKNIAHPETTMCAGALREKIQE